MGEGVFPFGEVHQNRLRPVLSWDVRVCFGQSLGLFVQVGESLQGCPVSSYAPYLLALSNSVTESIQRTQPLTDFFPVKDFKKTRKTGMFPSFSKTNPIFATPKTREANSHQQSKDVVAKHGSKVYGKAAIGAPPMSVPWLWSFGVGLGIVGLGQWVDMLRFF